MLLGYISSFLGIATFARFTVSQSNDCNGQAQIDNSTEAAALIYQCPSSEIDIELGNSISGNLSLDGLQTCGILRCSEVADSIAPNLISVGSNSLYLVSVLLAFTSLPALKSLSFPNLTQSGLGSNFSALILDALPLLTEFEFGAGFSIQDILIGDTGLKSFSTSLPDVTTPSTIIIGKNPDMSNVNLGLESCSGISILDNAPGAIIDFPNLRSIDQDGIIGDISSLNIPKLQVVNGSLNISAAQMTRFSAPSLQVIGGNFSLTGNFSEIDLPVLSNINGNVYVRGATGLNCSLFQIAHTSINGTLDCEGTAVPLSASTTTSSQGTASATSIATSITPATSSATSTTSAASTGLSSATKGGIGGGVAAGALVIIALAVWYFWQKRLSSSALRDTNHEHKNTPRKVTATELPLGRHHERSELEASPNEVSELTGDHKYRPRPLIESLPVTAPSSTQAVADSSENMQSARLNSPAELEWPRDIDNYYSNTS